MSSARRWACGLVAMLASAVIPAVAGATVSFHRDDLPAGGTPVSVALGDLDGVHGPDIVTAMSGGGISVRLNNGDGTFAAPVTYSTVPAVDPACDPLTVVLGDETDDGIDILPDGKLDAVVNCYDGRIGRMVGDGAGHLGTITFSSPYLNTGGSLFSQPDRIALVRWRTPTGPLVLVWGRQGVTFVQNVPTNYWALCFSYDWATADCSATSVNDPGVIGLSAIASGDVNGVGADEVLTSGGTGTRIFSIDTVNPHALDWADRMFGTYETGGTVAFAAGDLDSDGHPDVITASGSSMGGAINVIRATATGLPDVAPTTTASAAGLQKIAIGDFDGDGHNDVFAVTQYGRAVVQSGDGAGGLGPPQDVPLVGYQNPAYAAAMTMATGDLDGNGTPDAVVVDESSKLIEVLRNLDVPTAPPPVATVPPPLPPSPFVPPVIPFPIHTSIAAPLTGLKAVTSSASVGTTGSFTVGSAANPPIASVTVIVTVPGTTARTSATKHKAKVATLARITIKIPANATKKLTLKLNAAARRLLAKHHRLSATLTIQVTGTTGTRATKTRKLALKAPSARHH